MATAQEQYTEMVKQSQDAVLTAVDTWTRTVQDAFAQLPTASSRVAPDQVIDQVYDFAGKVLDMQRDFAKNVLHSTATVTDSLRDTANRTVDASTHEG